jgi:hypothetical protein
MKFFLAETLADQQVPGSKLSLTRDSITMALDLLHFRLNYTLWIWKVQNAKAE